MDEALKQAVALGREHYEKRDYDKAEHHLCAVIASGQRFADIHNMMGVSTMTAAGSKPRATRSSARSRSTRSYTEAALNLVGHL